MYKSDEHGERWECDNCGAKLPAPDETGHRTCSYCRAVYAAKKDQSAPGGMTFVIETPPQIVYDANQILAQSQDLVASSVKASKMGCLFSWIILLVVLAAVAVPIYFAIQEMDAFDSLGIGGGSSYRVTRDAGIILPTEPSQLDVATPATGTGGDTSTYILGLGGAGLTEQWASEKLGGSASSVQLASDFTKVYVTDDRRVIALRRSDGGQEWQGTMADSLSGACDNDCMFVVGDRLVVGTTDGTVQAYDTATGQPAWSKRLGQVSTSWLPVGDAIVLVDGTSSSDSRLVALNASDGTERHAFDATCTDGRSSSTPSQSIFLQRSPDDATFVVGYGTIPTCVQLFDAGSGARLWSTDLGSGGSMSGVTDQAAAWSASHLVLATGRQMLAFDRATGAPLATIEESSQSYLPLGFTPTAFVYLVTDNRGTTKYYVRAAALDTWLPTVEHVLPGEPAATAFSSTVSSNDVMSAVHLDGTDVRIVSFSGQDQMLTVETLDANTGAVSPSTRIDPGVSELIPSFAELGWRGPKVVLLVAGAIVEVDSAEGKLTGSWPKGLGD